MKHLSVEAVEIELRNFPAGVSVTDLALHLRDEGYEFAGTSQVCGALGPLIRKGVVIRRGVSGIGLFYHREEAIA